jgi:hypothetical protein
MLELRRVGLGEIEEVIVTCVVMAGGRAGPIRCSEI